MSEQIPSSIPPWESRVQIKLHSILSQIPPEYIHPELTHSTTSTKSVQNVPETLLTPTELHITSLPPSSLHKSITDNQYTAVQILNAFTHRAVIAHQLLNCCLDFPYQRALAKATELDTLWKETGKIKGRLHGVPISVKDQLRVKGTETTCGFVANLGMKDEEDSLLVEIMENEGAIVFTKTSCSMACMWGETVNSIIGRTSNPFNLSFSCGGSSGGEGALIGFHGSPLGIGSDLGGSIRSPSAYNGLWGLRPSHGRVPYFKILNSMEGQLTIPSVVGPMSHSPESLELFMKVVADSKPWLRDPQCHPIPWRQPELDRITNGKKLRIGVMHWDGIILPQVPVRRAMKTLEKVLADAGHEILPWKIDQAKALELVNKVFTSDANSDINRTVARSQEPPLPVLSNSKAPPLTLLESWDLAQEVYKFRAAVLKQWNETSLSSPDSEPMDCYIAPVNPSVCFKHGQYTTSRYNIYTGTVNLLDFSGCCIPVTFVSDSDIPDREDGKKDANGEDIPEITCELDGRIRENFRKGGYSGLPVSVQVVGRRLEEEKILGIARVVKELLGNLVF